MYAPGDEVLTPDGPGRVESLLDGRLLVRVGYVAALYAPESLRPARLAALTPEEAVAAERNRIAAWLTDETKPLLAMGHVDAVKALQAVRERVLRGD